MKTPKNLLSFSSTLSRVKKRNKRLRSSFGPLRFRGDPPDPVSLATIRRKALPPLLLNHNQRESEPGVEIGGESCKKREQLPYHLVLSNEGDGQPLLNQRRGLRFSAQKTQRRWGPGVLLRKQQGVPHIREVRNIQEQVHEAERNCGDPGDEDLPLDWGFRLGAADNLGDRWLVGDRADLQYDILVFAEKQHYHENTCA